MSELPVHFLCTSCGARHDLAEINFGADAPLQWEMLSPDERESSTLTADQCVIESREGSSFYIRGCLQVPIRETGRCFEWGVWCSLSERSFFEMQEHWTDPERASLGPYFGWLCTKIPMYPDTMYLKSMVHQRGVGLRPTVELEPSGHPLAVDQREGIETARLSRIVEELRTRTAMT